MNIFIMNILVNLEDCVIPEWELDKLKEEFLHHQMKVEEYNSLQEDFNVKDGKTCDVS
jgi:hypothetical protein